MKIKPQEWVEPFGCSSIFIEVLLDGIPQRNCVEADDELGYVVCFRTDSHQTERRTGRVEFRKMVEWC